MRSEFGGPVPEIGAQFRGAPGLHWQVLVAEPLDAGEHVGDDLVVESWVVVGGPVEELVAAESVGEIVDVGEVPGFGAAEQGQSLAGGEIAQAQGGSQVGGIDRFFCRAVSAEVDNEALPAAGDQQADGVALVDHSLVRPSALADRGFERGGGGRDRGRGCVEGEQVDVSGLALDQALHDQRGAAGDREVGALGQAEGQLRGF